MPHVLHFLYRGVADRLDIDIALGGEVGRMDIGSALGGAVGRIDIGSVLGGATWVRMPVGSVYNYFCRGTIFPERLHRTLLH